MGSCKTKMSSSTPIPSSVTCFKNGLSHLTFPVIFRAGLSPIKIGPLTTKTVNGSVSVIPEDTNLKIYSITGENNQMIKVHYKLENQEEDGKGNFSYISPGIKWTPYYLVKVKSEDKKLTIGGRATIVSDIQFLDDITLPQLSLVSGVPNIACAGEHDPFITNSLQKQQQQQVRMRHQMIDKCSAGPMHGRSGHDPDYDMIGDHEDEAFDEEKVGELYHFKIKNVPINFQKATSVPFMDDIMDIPFENNFTISLDNSKADNTEVPAKHHFKFPMKYTPPLPRGPVMIYLQKENGLTFSSQTQLRPDRDMFRLETTNSNEVLACYSVISGEKTSTRRFDISHTDPTQKSDRKSDQKTEKRKILCTTSKIATIVIKNKKKEKVEIHLAVTIQGVINIKQKFL